MRGRVAAVFAASIATTTGLGAVATAASGPPPPPIATSGAKVQRVAAGLHTPTSFAFGARVVFAGDGGSQTSSAPGGVYLLRRGAATKLAGSPRSVFGLVWHRKTLYVSAGNKLLAWSGWTGKKFTKRRTIYTAPKKFSGFNGLAFGADGRLYAGVDTGANNDHSPPNTPYLYDILSFRPNGKGLQVFATGMRQPWQLVFPAHSSSPFVSDFGQDTGAKNPPDFLLRVHKGDNYGFPKCSWTKMKPCKGFTKPFEFFPSHTDVGGVGIIGGRIYMSEFGFTAPLHPPLVVSMSVKGGAVKPVLTGFSAPVIGLGTHGRWLYFGEVTGQIFRVKV